MKNKKLPIINVLKVTDNPDGSATMDFEVDDSFVEFYKQQTGKKTVTERGLSKYVLKLLKDSVEEKNGFSLKL